MFVLVDQMRKTGNLRTAQPQRLLLFTCGFWAPSRTEYSTYLVVMSRQLRHVAQPQQTRKLPTYVTGTAGSHCRLPLFESAGQHSAFQLTSLVPVISALVLAHVADDFSVP